MYSLRFEATVIDELAEATSHFLIVFERDDPEGFYRLIRETFEVYLRHPEAAAPYSLPSLDSLEYRPVNVWKFAFLYRVDRMAKEVVIDRIYHVRSSQL